MLFVKICLFGKYTPLHRQQTNKWFENTFLLLYFINKECFQQNVFFILIESHSLLNIKYTHPPSQSNNNLIPDEIVGLSQTDPCWQWKWEICLTKPRSHPTAPGFERLFWIPTKPHLYYLKWAQYIKDNNEARGIKKCEKCIKFLCCISQALTSGVHCKLYKDLQESVRARIFSPSKIILIILRENY